jgi:c(7)-type cytochrome triheme protein
MKFRYSFFLASAIILVFSFAYAVNVKEVTFSGRNYGKVEFNHNIHINQKSIRNNCKACHNAIFNIQKKKTYTMADMKKGKSCGFCHNGEKASNVEDCNKCHKVPDVIFKVKETGPVIFSHTMHSAVDQCSGCHPKLYKTGQNKPVGMTQMEKGKSCGACHYGEKAFKIEECQRCHPVKEVDFKVKDSGDVKFSHQMHTGMYRCGDCHDKLYLPSVKNKRITMAEMEAAKSCGACHDGKSAFTVKENCDKCHKM